MNPLLNKCPVCGGDLIVTRLHCPSCETTLEGSFAPGGNRLQEAFSLEQLKPLLPFSRLSAEQLQFVLTFVRCEGRFNRMEEELGLSYPTLRSRLDEIVRAMGFEPAREEAAAASAFAAAERLPGPAQRQEILDMLNRGEIDVEEARRRLRGEAPRAREEDYPLPEEPALPVSPPEVPAAPAEPPPEEPLAGAAPENGPVEPVDV